MIELTYEEQMFMSDAFIRQQEQTWATTVLLSGSRYKMATRLEYKGLVRIVKEPLKCFDRYNGEVQSSFEIVIDDSFPNMQELKVYCLLLQ